MSNSRSGTSEAAGMDNNSFIRLFGYDKQKVSDQHISIITQAIGRRGLGLDPYLRYPGQSYRERELFNKASFMRTKLIQESEALEAELKTRKNNKPNTPNGKQEYPDSASITNEVIQKMIPNDPRLVAEFQRLVEKSSDMERSSIKAKL
jgi:hypothetical protein